MVGDARGADGIVGAKRAGLNGSLQMLADLSRSMHKAPQRSLSA